MQDYREATEEEFLQAESANANRVNWPFKTMKVGQVILFNKALAKKAQNSIGAYAKRLGFKFETKIKKDTGECLVKRVK